MTRRISSSFQTSSSTPLCQPQLTKTCSISFVVHRLFIFDNICVNRGILGCVPQPSEPLYGLAHGCSTPAPEAVSGSSPLVFLPVTLAESARGVNVTEVYPFRL